MRPQVRPLRFDWLPFHAIHDLQHYERDPAAWLLFVHPIRRELSNPDIRKFKPGAWKKDYRVEFNRPYAGAYIAFNYCQPRKNIFTIQLEINRSLYMNENVFQKTQIFKRLVMT